MLAAIGFVFLLIIGTPIAFMLGSVGYLHLLAMGNPAFFDIVTQRMFSGVNQFSLMAIPFFILAGELMNKGGVTAQLIDFSRECVGYLRGGLAYVAVVVAMFLAAILGSANAVAAILGSVLAPEMVKDGFDDDFTSALIAASSIIGPIIPPSVVFILYGVLSGTSVSALFLAGYVPGILLGIGYMVVSYIQAKKRNYPRYKERFEPIKLLKSFVRAVPALIVPVIIIGGILSGAFTPTESGAIAVVVAAVSGLFIYRKLRPRDIPGILLNTGMITAGIMLIIAMGNIFGWTLAMDKAPQKFADAVLRFTNNPNVVMLLIIVLMLFVGTVMEAFASMIVFTPVLAPLAAQVGIDPVHFGLVFSVLSCIALITPPVGMCLFVTSGITNVPLSKMNKAILPFVCVSIIALLIMAYVPSVVLFLPRTFLK
ncbi:MAG TPA: TRAP transporter large permease [Firmicutes bacterium]|nr:TRAP transporter large permease [Bacillota bacterium]